MNWENMANQNCTVFCGLVLHFGDNPDINTFASANFFVAFSCVWVVRRTGTVLIMNFRNSSMTKPVPGLRGTPSDWRPFFEPLRYGEGAGRLPRGDHPTQAERHDVDVQAGVAGPWAQKLFICLFPFVFKGKLLSLSLWFFGEKFCYAFSFNHFCRDKL